MKNIFQEYIGMIMVLLTIAIILYYFRKQIFGDIAAVAKPIVQKYQADIATIQDTDFVDLAKNVYKSVANPYISQEQQAENIAATDAALLAKGIIPYRLRTPTIVGGI